VLLAVARNRLEAASKLIAGAANILVVK